MAKAFESLFGSVTCLPGCFTLFRLRTSDTHKPLLISNQMIQDYSENRVDTLHVKNLLHLGEDRYLTTLLLKHFPLYKTQFIRDAHAFTVAPDDWKVLLSQRRRWINSTVHNLAELIFLEQLCGFCCFSMRFVVLIDLLSTLTQPVTVAYVSVFVGHDNRKWWCILDCLPGLPRRRRRQTNSYPFTHLDRCHLWATGAHIHFPSKMGHDRMDGFLYTCISGILLPSTDILILAHGRFLLGRYSFGPWRIG